ncbi:MAG: ornithine cyclodeaminase family protein [Cyanobacteria bacterium J06554_6]
MGLADAHWVIDLRQCLLHLLALFYMIASLSAPTNNRLSTMRSPLQTQLLSVDDIRQIAQHVGLDALMDEMIVRLDDALCHFDPTQTVIPVRTGFNYRQPNVGLVEWMPLFQKSRQIVVKAVGYHPRNPELYALPTVLSTISAYDPASGHLLAVVDGTFLTALRTGAASALASRHLARPDSRVLGLVGAGAQAVTQLHALSRGFDLKQVWVYDIDPDVMTSFAERVAPLNIKTIKIQPAQLADVVAAADILCTATSVDVGEGPVFADGNLKPWLHVNAVGADFPGKIEVPLSLLERGFVCPDFRKQALIEGECQQLMTSQATGAELFEIVQYPDRYQPYQQQPTVFDSTGFALEDQVALNMLLDYARELQVGTWTYLESAAADVKNPYSFVSSPSTEHAVSL